MNKARPHWRRLVSRLLPRSSFGRVALSVGLILLLAQAASLLLLRIYIVTPNAQQSGRGLGLQLQLARSLPSAALDQARRRGDLLFATSAPPVSDAVLQLNYYAVLVAAAGNQLGTNTELLQTSHPQRSLWTPLPQGRGWIGVAMPNPQATIGLPLLLWVLLVVVAALGSAALAVRYLDRPLRRLADAAGRFGRGEVPEPVAPSGPQEVRSLTHGFNRMVADQTRLEDDRRLFLAGVSHDLRTPLTRQRLTLEMMDPGDAALQAEALRNIDDMEGIVAQFMDYLQGETREPPRPLDLVQLLQSVARPYRERGLDLKLVLDDDPRLGELPLREQAMKRLLTNLLDNAERHADGREVTLTTGIDIDGRCCLTVADRGPGIPEADLARALQPYTRIGNSGGSGLGLAIVARIARQEGFELELRNRERGGLCVMLRR